MDWYTLPDAEYEAPSRKLLTTMYLCRERGGEEGSERGIVFVFSSSFLPEILLYAKSTQVYSVCAFMSYELRYNDLYG